MSRRDEACTHGFDALGKTHSAKARMPTTSNLSSSAECPVDLRKREFLAQPVSLPVVRVEVDRLRIDESFIHAVELLLNRLRIALRFSSVAADDGLTLVPRAQNEILHNSHIARCR